jgi:8-oxo-dGTP diphosphatase
MDRRFNVRVYGICFNDKDELLVADEFIKGMELTKFPGGGLEFGEGTRDCIQREFLEETGQEIEVIRHFYTTDFFVASAFNPQSQVISIYYLVKLKEAPRFSAAPGRFDFPKREDNVFVFRWLPRKAIHPDEFTFVIDKRVAGMLMQEFSQ